MNRNGFALVSVLWLTVLLVTVATQAMDLARIETAATGNRVTFRRAGWARSACAAIVEARMAKRESVRGLDSVDLGAGSWCSARVEPGFDRVDLNRATAPQLRALLRADSLIEALRDWIDADTLAGDGSTESAWYRGASRRPPRNGPLAAVDELLLIRGFDSAFVESLRDRVVVWAAGIPADCVPDRCAVDGGTIVVALKGYIGGSPIHASERRVVRRAGGRMAVLVREVE